MSQAQAIHLLSAPAIGMEYLGLHRYTWRQPGHRHIHESLQILIILTGKTDIQWQGISTPRAFHADQLAIMPPRLAHQVETTSLVRSVDLIDMRINLAHQSELATAWREHSQRPAVLQGQAGLNAQLREMVLQAAAMPAAARLHMLSAIGWQMLAMADSAMQPSRQLHIDRRLQAAERFMADHLTQPIGSEHVARACGLSISQLNRLYRQHRSVTPARHLMAMRLEMARELLPASLLTLKQIARECGFTCVNHFSRVFRQHVGMTPGEYRQQQVRRAPLSLHHA